MVTLPVPHREFPYPIGTEGTVLAVPVYPELHALLQSVVLLLIRAYSVIGVPIVTALVFVTAPPPPTPEPSLFVVPSVDHSTVYPLPGSVTVNITFPLSHLVWLLKPAAIDGSEFTETVLVPLTALHPPGGLFVVNVKVTVPA
jgi:hypothetical protein